MIDFPKSEVSSKQKTDTEFKLLPVWCAICSRPACVEVGNASTVLVVETLRIIPLARSKFRLSNTNRFGFVTTLSLGEIP